MKEIIKWNFAEFSTTLVILKWNFQIIIDLAIARVYGVTFSHPNIPYKNS